MGANDWDELEWFDHDWLIGLPDWALWELELWVDRRRDGPPLDPRRRHPAD